MSQDVSTAADQIVTLHNAHARGPIVLVCEHASAHIPSHLEDLGIALEHRLSHAVWDPGALAVSLKLAHALNAKLVASEVSRLVYDCNRPPHDLEAMRARSEIVHVPGNTGLSDAQRTQRVTRYYEPFKAAVGAALDQTPDPILVTIHSFTPVFHGQPRSVEFGILHDADTRLADTMLSKTTDSNVQRNAPYGPEDGVTHTLKEHGLARGIPNVMLEIRNDLIDTETQHENVARRLDPWLRAALSDLGARPA